MRRKIVAFEFSRDGRRIAAIAHTGVAGEGATLVWDLAAGTKLFDQRIQVEPWGLDRVALSPDGALLLVGGADTNPEGLIKIWDIGPGRLLHSLSDELTLSM